MNKEHILKEIKRTARENGGVPLGRLRFSAVTEIKYSDWHGKHWVRWNDAIREAGLEPNQKSEAYSNVYLIEKIITLIREIGRFPVYGDFRMKAYKDKDFPSDSVFSRLCSKQEWISKVVEYCRANDEFEDVLPLCVEEVVTESSSSEGDDTFHEKIGYVYLLKHGSRKEYKIGKTFNPLRREGEIALQLPEKLTPIHYIETDDASGIEAYWHSRFAKKRKEGEWFALTMEEVRAFKRWKRIY